MNDKLIRFYKKKKILITGHTGFVGTWLTLLLNQLDTKLYGISLKDNNKSIKAMEITKKQIKTIYADIKNLDKLKKIYKSIKPDICIHLAAQPIVIDSYLNPIRTIESNVLGTANILECINKFSTKYNLIITTDKCYENNEQKKFFKENDSLGGKDIYSASKACAEILTKSYYHSFLKKKRIKIFSVRAGNIIGGGDFGKYRLIPDIFNCINSNKKIIIRSPNSIRPWQNILDVIYGYLILIFLQKSKNYNFDSWNIGPNKKESNYKVKKIIELINKRKNIKVIFKNSKFNESKVLKLDNSKIKKIGWRAKYSLEKSLIEINNWYSIFFQKKGIKNYNKKIIQNFLENIDN
jgi:CDP-glucose 4,6-dehydratase